MRLPPVGSGRSLLTRPSRGRVYASGWICLPPWGASTALTEGSSPTAFMCAGEIDRRSLDESGIDLGLTPTQISDRFQRASVKSTSEVLDCAPRVQRRPTSRVPGCTERPGRTTFRSPCTTCAAGGEDRSDVGRGRLASPDYSWPQGYGYRVYHRNPKRKRGELVRRPSLTLRVTMG